MCPGIRGGVVTQVEPVAPVPSNFILPGTPQTSRLQAAVSTRAQSLGLSHVILWWQMQAPGGSPIPCPGPFIAQYMVAGSGSASKGEDSTLSWVIVLGEWKSK